MQYVHVRGSRVIFGRHVTKRRSDWPELFGMASQGIGPKIPDHLFRGHFVSGSGGMGTRLDIVLQSR